MQRKKFQENIQESAGCEFHFNGAYVNEIHSRRTAALLTTLSGSLGTLEFHFDFKIPDSLWLLSRHKARTLIALPRSLRLRET